MFRKTRTCASGYDSVGARAAAETAASCTRMGETASSYFTSTATTVKFERQSKRQRKSGTSSASRIEHRRSKRSFLNLKARAKITSSLDCNWNGGGSRLNIRWKKMFARVSVLNNLWISFSYSLFSLFIRVKTFILIFSLKSATKMQQTV